MKKSLFAAILMCAFSIVASSAQTPGNCPATDTDGTCCHNNRQNAGRCCPALFEGIELTAEQQTALQALRTECAEHCNAQAQTREDRANRRTEYRRTHLNKIKGILTPEQYTVFLENSFINSNCNRNARHNRHGHHNRQFRREARMNGQTPAAAQRVNQQAVQAAE